MALPFTFRMRTSTGNFNSRNLFHWDSKDKQVTTVDGAG
jgi:hypothetical protein